MALLEFEDEVASGIVPIIELIAAKLVRPSRIVQTWATCALHSSVCP
jgi:hypothetical protein